MKRKRKSGVPRLGVCSSGSFLVKMLPRGASKCSLGLFWWERESPVLLLGSQNLSPAPPMGALCQTITIYSDAISPSRTLSVKLWRDQPVTSMTAIRTNTQTTTGLELDQRRCYSVLTFFFFFFLVCFYSDCFAVCLSYTLFSLRNATGRVFFSPSTADVSESSNSESSLQQISHSDKATQRIPAVCRERSEKTHYQQLLVRVWFLFFSSSAQPTWVLLCISFENKAPFWSNVSFLQVSFLFICILYMFTLYLALPNRETILNVLSLLFYIGSASFIPHLQSQGTVADKDKAHFGHNRHLAG